MYDHRTGLSQTAFLLNKGIPAVLSTPAVALIITFDGQVLC